MNLLTLKKLLYAFNPSWFSREDNFAIFSENLGSGLVLSHSQQKGVLCLLGISHWISPKTFALITHFFKHGNFFFIFCPYCFHCCAYIILLQALYLKYLERGVATRFLVPWRKSGYSQLRPAVPLRLRRRRISPLPTPTQQKPTLSKNNKKTHRFLSIDIIAQGYSSGLQ